MLATIAIHALDSVSVNLLEVYNEEIHDLLVEKKNQELLEIRRGPQGVFIPGLSTVPVKSAEEVMEVGFTSQVANCLLNKRPFWGGGVHATDLGERKLSSDGDVDVNERTVFSLTLAAHRQRRCDYHTRRR